MTWTDTKSTGSTLTAVEYNNLANHVRPTATVTVAKSEPADYVTTNYDSDYACIRAALEYINSINGGKVVIREGNYSLEAMLQIYSSTELELVSGAILTQTADAEIIQNKNPGGSDHDIYIHGGELDGNSTGATGRSGVYLYSVTNSLIENIYVHHTTGVSIRLHNCMNSIVRDNTVKYPGAVYGGSTTPGISSGGDPTHGGGDPKYGGVSYIRILNNYISNSPGEGIDINHYSSKVIVDGNILLDNTYEGIDAGWCYDVIVSNNIIYNSQYGIHPPWTGTVSNNNIIGGQYGIKTSATHLGGVSLINNTISEQSASGIYILGSGYYNISNNTLFRNKFYGLQLSDADYCLISNNSILDNGVGNRNNRSGIYIGGSSSYNTIIGNNCTDKQDSISKLLTATASSGQKEITVSDSTVFYDDQHISITDDSNTETAIIDTIDHTTNIITVTINLTNSYTVAANGYVIGRKSQGWGIGEYDTADYNTYKDNELRGNSRSAGFQNLVGTHNIVVDNPGHNPVGAVGPPSVPATTVNYTNAYGYPCTVVVSGGTVTEIDIDDVATGLTSGVMPTIPPGGTINITYSAAPSWLWWGL